MSLGYASARRLIAPNSPFRRISQAVSYSTVLGSRRVGNPTTLSTITMTTQGTTGISTTEFQFPVGSANMSGSGSTMSFNGYNTTTTAGGYPTGTGDFCIEGWLYVPSSRPRDGVNTGDLGGLNITGGLMVRFGAGYRTNGFNWIQVFARGALDGDRAPFNWPNNTWTHFAVQRKSGTVTIWANGNKLARENGPGGTVSTYSFASSTNGQLVWGSYTPNTTDEDLRCFVDELCVSNSWRYDDTLNTYVIPTSPFFVDQYTCLLYHFDTNFISAAT